MMTCHQRRFRIPGYVGSRMKSAGVIAYHHSQGAACPVSSAADGCVGDDVGGRLVVVELARTAPRPGTLSIARWPGPGSVGTPQHLRTRRNQGAVVPAGLDRGQPPPPQLRPGLPPVAAPLAPLRRRLFGGFCKRASGGDQPELSARSSLWLPRRFCRPMRSQRPSSPAKLQQSRTKMRCRCSRASRSGTSEPLPRTNR